MRNNNEFKQRMSLVKAVIPGLQLEAVKKLVENQIDIFTEIIWKNPEKIIWTNMVMPLEIFYAAGLVPINMELVAGWLATLGLSKKYIMLSESMGFSPTLCSYHKAVLGVCENGDLPFPRAAAITSHLCDGGNGVVNHFVHRYDTCSYTLNIPYHNNGLHFSYVLQQYRELIKWLEDYTGSKLSNEKLSRALELSNRAREYWVKVLQLRRGVPLINGHLALRNLFGATFLFGTEIGVEVAKAYHQQLCDSKAAESKTDSNRSTKRILWIHFAPLYANQLMEYLEEQLNCRIVFDITGYIYWPEYELEKPLESLTQRTLSHFYMGDAQERKNLYSSLIKDFRIDGVIHFMHNGCRAIPGWSWQVRQVAEEGNIPFLEISGDCVDPRGFSEEQMRLRLEAFNEALRRDEFVFRS
ncbi:2-hydroxyacyl-CoA dehydratase subunit D [Alkaliphilus peptidifermentans]|uniref:Benzoyl-CoA reductase/2-hydroxyglutaryl-CoA dehydratase subunit, BcrC/BadD/HgdB n=1 Tax=Alkaliphilus peptidifermentans DSM 18978 TaxID=1120976 RepID=A0A1G5I2V5_9FIRM|nr:2-hydroxyacyl-CoA dehydratase family protein [Alkaliphilus peptidifermentans]SCY70455.1 Benzoyl-CoA reductase/2-hydroxyglutaryl-CoA dehydratase subunit, BcrC/BadD/HgdB [Alkaliphilus peptidifermentans DSM 18978]